MHFQRSEEINRAESFQQEIQVMVKMCLCNIEKRIQSYADHFNCFLMKEEQEKRCMMKWEGCWSQSHKSAFSPSNIQYPGVMIKKKFWPVRSKNGLKGLPNPVPTVKVTAQALSYPPSPWTLTATLLGKKGQSRPFWQLTKARQRRGAMWLNE